MPLVQQLHKKKKRKINTREPINNHNKLHPSPLPLPQTTNIPEIQRKSRFSRLTIVVVESWKNNDVSWPTTSRSHRGSIIDIQHRSRACLPDIRGDVWQRSIRGSLIRLCIPRFPMDPTGTRTRVRYLGRGRKLPRPNTNG